MDKAFCEFFAGIGLVRAALDRGGWRCAFANDIDPKKQAMHHGHFGHSPAYWLGDVWDADAVLARIADRPALATASFPCTDLSLAGKRRGLAGTQSGALGGFLDVLARLDDRRPPLVLLENVPGFLSSRGGVDFAATCGALAELGYCLDAFQLDAQWFVPQSRQRLFLVGYAAAVVEAGAEQFCRRVGDAADGQAWDDPWERAVRRANRIRPSKLLAAIARTELSSGWATQSVDNPPRRLTRLADFLDAGDDQDWWEPAQVTRHEAMLFPRHRRQLELLVADPAEVTLLTGFRRVRQGAQRLEVRFDGVAGCLRTPRGGSAKQVVLRAGRGELRMRWMSPREYARLQGAPGFALPENNIQAWFGFGDAVCVPVIEWIDQAFLTPAWNAWTGRGDSKLQIAN